MVQQLTVSKTWCGPVFDSLEFCGFYPFRSWNPEAIVKIASPRKDLDSYQNFGTNLTRQWSRTTKKNYRDGFMNCLYSDDRVVISVPDIYDQGFLRVEWEHVGAYIEIKYPYHSAKSILRMVMANDKMGIGKYDGHELTRIQAIAVCSVTVCNGLQDITLGSGPLLDMIQDGQLKGNFDYTRS